MTSRTKIKVDVTALIKKIEECRATAVKLYDVQVETYNRALPYYRAAVVTHLTRVVQAVAAKRADLPANYYGDYLRVELPRDFPNEPVEPSLPDLSGYDKDIAFLSLAAEETLLMATDDRFMRYL